MEPQTAGAGEPGLPRRREPDLAGLATFMLDARGRVVSWSVTATAVFGRPAGAVIGRDVCDVLMTGPGQRKLVRHALAEVAANRVWTATVAADGLGEGRFAIRWEPVSGLAEPTGIAERAEPAGTAATALVIARRATPRPGPSWLSEAAARIGSTLDLTQTASEFVDAAVPGFAEAAILYVAERLLTADEVTSSRVRQGSVMRRLAARMAGQEAAVADGLLPPGEVLVFGEDTPSFRAMETGEPVLSDRRHGGRGATVSYTSLLAVPLAARGSVLGCAVFGRTAATPAFTHGEIALAGELTAHAALCIDNALLYHRERRTALALQRGLLPGWPEIPAGLEVAQRYLPVGISVVGGDWHDIVSLPGGWAALIVGDAMGHGPEAAAVMVQLRTAAHTLADLGLSPEQVLSRLDRMASGMTTTQFATCISMIINPASSSCVTALAGHLPPVLVLPGGATRVLDLPPGLPLGLGAKSFAATQISLPPGATIALYTDGLVESRTRPIDDGLAALCAALDSALARGGATLGDTCQSVTQELRQQGEDDITLVLARIRSATTSPRDKTA